jgi:hypothetical protein
MTFRALWSLARDDANPLGRTGGCSDPMSLRSLTRLFPFHGETDVDDIVRNDTEADTAVHSDNALIVATLEVVSQLDYADMLLISDAPLLAVAETAFSLFAFAFRAFGSGIWDAEAFYAHCHGCRLILRAANRPASRAKAIHSTSTNALSMQFVQQITHR